MKRTSLLALLTVSLAACSPAGDKPAVQAASPNAAATEPAVEMEQAALQDASTAPPHTPTEEQDMPIILEPERDADGKIIPVQKSLAQWAADLSPAEFNILREQGTERAFTGRYYDSTEDGVYACAGCGLVLFDSSTKYDSGCGWPSFYQSIQPDYVLRLQDDSHGMNRIENRCARCGGHLGHVFPDGPKPTGLRYCMNGTALRFIERSKFEELKKLAESPEASTPKP